MRDLYYYSEYSEEIELTLNSEYGEPMQEAFKTFVSCIQEAVHIRDMKRDDTFDDPKMNKQVKDNELKRRY